jgi:hypothetical protein
MTNTYTINKIAHMVEVATTLSRSWFKGQARIHGELTPRVFRSQYDSIRKIRPQFELSLNEALKRSAPVLQANIPKQEDHIAWPFQWESASLRLP